MATMTLTIPETLYTRLKERAALNGRANEEEAAEWMSAAAEAEEGLPQELADELADLDHLSDDELWRAARVAVPAADAGRMADLNLAAKKRPLDSAELVEQGRLLAVIDRAMLVRAKSAALLKGRGHDISSLAPRS